MTFFNKILLFFCHFAAFSPKKHTKTGKKKKRRIVKNPSFFRLLLAPYLQFFASDALLEVAFLF